MADAPDISVLVSARSRAWFAHEGRSHALLPRMAESLASSARLAGLRCELILADAGGNAGPADWLAASCPGVAVRVLDDRWGEYSRGRGLNRAAAIAAAECLAILQPDMWIVPEVLTRGLAVARAGNAYLPYYQRMNSAADAAWTRGIGTGNVVLSAETYRRAGRWPDRPWSEGPNDDTLFTAALKRLSGVELVREFPKAFAHLWHPAGMTWKQVIVHDWADPYASHLGVLAAAAMHCDGPFLEVGAGQFSTPLLRGVAAAKGTTLTSLETHPEWLHRAAADCGGHQVIATPDPAGWIVSRPDRWGLAFLDGLPAQRLACLRAAAAQAAVVVCHDSQVLTPGHSYEPALSGFRYRRDLRLPDWPPSAPLTSVASDTDDLAWLSALSAAPTPAAPEAK